MPLIIYRRGAVYWAEGRVAGQPVRQTLSTGKRAIALDRAAELENRLAVGLRPMGWSELRRRFLANYTGPTELSYKNLVHALETTFASKRHLHEVSLSDLERFIQRSEHKPNTIRLEVTHLRALWRWAFKRKAVAANIAGDLVMPRLCHAPVLPFKPSELVAIEKAIHALADEPSLVGLGAAKSIHARTWAMYQLLRTTGLRVSDLIRLRPENLVDDHLVYHTQKTKTGVRVALVDAAREAVEALTVRPSGYYFWSGRSAHTCAVSVGLTFRKLGKRAHVVGVSPHRFRHTFAATLLAAGADIRLLSRLLGHRSIRATERHYNPWIKVFQDQADAAVFAAELYSIERRQAGQPADRDFQSVD